MADSNQAKRAETDQFNDDDPFAELTRIMSHDPRVEDSNFQPQDLSIDMEKELMGEFDLSEFEAHEQAPQGPALEQDFAGSDIDEQYGFDSEPGRPAADIQEAQAAAPDHWVGDAHEGMDLAAGSADGVRNDDASAEAADDFDAIFHADLANEVNFAELGSNDVTDPESGTAFSEQEQPTAPVGGDRFAEPYDSALMVQSNFAQDDPQQEILPGSDAPDMAQVDMDFTTVQSENVAEEAVKPEHPQARNGWADHDNATPTDLPATDSAMPGDDHAVIAEAAPEPSLEDELLALLADDGGANAASELAYESVEPTAAVADASRSAAAATVSRPDMAPKPYPTVMSAPRQLAWADRSIEPLTHMPEAVRADQPPQESPRSYGMATAAPSNGAPEPFRRSTGPADQMETAASGDWQEDSRSHQDVDTPDFAEIFQEDDEPAALQESFEAISTPRSLPSHGAFVPDIETIEVVEPARSVEQEFDVPELPPEENVPQSYADLEDIEGDLASAFENFDPGMADEFEAAPAGQQDGETGQWEQMADAQAGFSASSFSDSQQDGQYYHPDLAHGEDYANNEQGAYEAYEDDYQEPAQPPLVAGRRKRKRGYLVAGLVAGVAVFGTAGVLGTTFLSGGNDGPVLIGANSDPVKVQPEERGGTVVPNQESEAYQRVAGETGESEPRQEQLITTAEEPLNLAAGELDMAPPRLAPGISDDEATPVEEARGFDLGSVKSEERIETAENQVASAESNDNLVLAPRRVRTMVVRPDGSIVPREEPSAADSASDGAEAVAGEQEAVASAQARDLDELLPQSVPPLEGEDASAGEAMNAAQEAPAEAAASQVSAPSGDETSPAAAPAESDVTAAEPQQVASAANAATSASSQATSEWSMQIASQPSAESAQATYQDLARQYGNLLEGRGVNIVRAEIDGRGTFYRVRIPASTRDEAVQLCTQYQSAGGSCFVSR